MPSPRKFKRLRREVAAKKALAEIEGTEGLTMRSDAIQAATIAENEIETFLDTGHDSALDRALHALESHQDGAVGDAGLFFTNAIEELEKVVDDDD